MSIESILNQIETDVSAQAEKIIQEVKLKAEKLKQEIQLEAEALYKESVEREKNLCERTKQRLLVQARLKIKNEILSVKQGLIGDVFVKLKTTLKKDKLKKQQISPSGMHEVPENIDFYLNKIRLEHEAEIAKLLFE